MSRVLVRVARASVRPFVVRAASTSTRVSLSIESKALSRADSTSVMRGVKDPPLPALTLPACCHLQAASQWSRLGGGAVVLATAGVGLAVLSPDTAHAAGGKVNWDAVRKDVVAVRVYRHFETELHGRGLLGP